MPREKKSPGLKILWVWTLGTAAILVTSVVRTRLRDMETLMYADQQQNHPQDQNFPDNSILVDSEVFEKDKSQV